MLRDAFEMEAGGGDVAEVLWVGGRNLSVGRERDGGRIAFDVEAYGDPCC